MDKLIFVLVKWLIYWYKVDVIYIVVAIMIVKA